MHPYEVCFPVLSGLSGYGLEVQTCTECVEGFYKATRGNDPCSSCPENYTTNAAGSFSPDSCIEVNMDTTFGASETQNSSRDGSTNNSVPAVALGISFEVLDGSPVDKDQFSEVLRQVFSGMKRIDTSRIAVRFAAATLRRLSSTMTVIVTMNYRTAEEAQEALDMDVNEVSSQIQEAAQESMALEVQPTVSEPEVESVEVRCEGNRAIPPGVVALTSDDCKCGPGFGLKDGECLACQPGEWKSTIEDNTCHDCDSQKSTTATGATSLAECKCKAGSYQSKSDESVCLPCKEGYFCDGSGQHSRCPENMTTDQTNAKTSTDCVCNKGYQNLQGFCSPCPSGRYKSNSGNGSCSSVCPINADSSPGSTAESDCQCRMGFHKKTEVGQDTFECASCFDYVGVMCPGGETNPVAKQGYFQTGPTMAVECRVRMMDEAETFSVCHGNNTCALGSAGWLCGECDAQFARDQPLQQCEPCWTQMSQVALISNVLLHLVQTSSVGFVLASLAASSAVTGVEPFSTSLIRIFTHWVEARLVKSMMLERNVLGLRLG